jgi:hypothetical protein
MKSSHSPVENALGRVGSDLGLLGGEVAQSLLSSFSLHPKKSHGGAYPDRFGQILQHCVVFASKLVAEAHVLGSKQTGDRH